MQFAQIPGFADLKQVLIQAAQSGHIAHAQLFAGTAGSAALPIALAFATYINCESRTDQDSCGQCPSCVKYNKLAHPDLNFVFPVATSKEVPDHPSSAAYMKRFRAFIETQPFGGPHEWGAFFGAENKQLNIPVGEARFIISSLSLKPYEAKWKVMFIWLPEFMNVAAANALLKVLEEPTPDTLFFLVTEDEESILGTILSRVQKIRIPQFEPDAIVEYLINHAGVAEKEAKTIARLAEGSLAEARRLLEEDTSIYFDLFSHWMRACYAHKYGDILQSTEQFGKLGREGQKNFFSYALAMLREALLANAGATDLVRLPEQEEAFVNRFSTFTHQDNMPEMLDIIGKAWADIEQNANGKIVFFDISMSLTYLLRQTVSAN